jgi:hypothetical protein
VNAGSIKIACGFTRAASPRETPTKLQSCHLPLSAAQSAIRTTPVMAAKYIISGMKYETGIAIGLNAVTEATKTDQPKVRYLDAIRKVKRIARANETEFMLLVQT